MSQERTLASQRVYQGRLVNLRVDTVELAKGRRTKREIVEHGEAAAVVALDSEDNVLLVRQFRKPVEKLLLEIPAGGVEPGESPEHCALRELQEETGYLAHRIEKLGSFYTTPGFCTELMHLFLATQLQPGQKDAEEAIELVLVPLAQAAQLIVSGEICDAKSIAGLLWVSADYQSKRR